jgi:hypothetical protein
MEGHNKGIYTVWRFHQNCRVSSMHLICFYSLAWYKPPLGEVVVRRLTEDGVWRETAFRDILVTADQRVLVWRARGKPTSTRYQIPRSIEEDATTTRVIGEVNGEEESTDSDVDIPEVPGNEAETTND